MPTFIHRRWLAWVLLVWTLPACSSSPESAPPHTSTLNVELTEVLTVGLETHENDLLGQPVAVGTDSDGRLLIADRSIPAIRVFDADGQWQHDIGGRGEGPVEFTGTTALHNVSPDTFLVVDGHAMRATLLSSAGEELDIWPMVTSDGGHLVILSALRHLHGRELIIGWNPISTNPTDDHPTEVLHYVRRTEEGYRTEQQFFDAAEELGFAQYGRSASPMGSALLLSDETLLYAHQLYTGTIQHFTYYGDNATWIQKTPWTGVVERETAYENVPSEAYPGPNISRAGSPAGLFYARTFNQSAGLATLPDGRIAHFTRIKVDGEEQFGVEVYEFSGELVGYAALWRRPYPEDPSRLPYVDAVEEAGQVYLRARDEETGAPVVQVMQLKIPE